MLSAIDVKAVMTRILICDNDRGPAPAPDPGSAPGSGGLTRALAGALTPMGHEVATTTGAELLAAASSRPPDLVIMALGSPENSDAGLEATRQLKARFQDGSFLPVILVTKRAETALRVRGFAAGCDDHLEEPVDVHELRVRVTSLLERRAQDARLREANARLREADKLKRELVALVVHDLRNPLSALSVHLELLEAELADGHPETRQALSDCRQITAHALSMVAGLLDVAQLEENILRVNRAETVISEFLPVATRYCAAYLKHRKLSLEVQVSPPGLRGSFDPDLLGRVLENLVNNGTRYASYAGRLRLSVFGSGRDLVFEVANSGPPIPEAERGRVFEKYYRVEERRVDARSNRGLGLYFCRLAVEAHGGTIVVEERPDFPTCFVIRIPQG